MSSIQDQAALLTKAADEAAAEAREAGRRSRVAKLRARIFDTLIGRGSYTVIAHRGFHSLAYLRSCDELKFPWREGVEYFRFVPTSTEDLSDCAHRAAETIVAMGDER